MAERETLTTATPLPQGGFTAALGNELLHERDVLASYFGQRRRATTLDTLPGDLVSRALLSGRQWKGWLTRYLRAYADPERTSLDVGANIGAHVATLARHSFEVVALEPQTAAYRCDLRLSGPCACTSTGRRSHQ